MKFNDYVLSILGEMARADKPLQTSSIEEWPYTNYDFEGKSSAFEYFHGRYPTEAIQQMIRSAALELSQDSELQEISVGDLKNRLKSCFESGTTVGGKLIQLKSKHAAKHAGRAVEQLVAFLKSKSNNTKQKVAHTMAAAVKSIEQSPRQAFQIATQSAEDAAEVVSKDVNPSISSELEPKPTTSGKTTDYGKILSSSHEVTEDAFESLKDKLTPINKRLVKNKLAPIELKISGERLQPRKDSSTSLVKLIKFDIVVPPMELPGGWKFVARVDHEAAGNIIVSVPNSRHERDLHAMYGNSQPSYCDHCHTTRRRTSTFIVENDKGELKRIGRQCLKGYLPGGEIAVKGIVSMAEYLTSLALGIIELESKDYDDQGGGEGGGGIPKYQDANSLMALGLYVVDNFGYVSRSRASAAYETGDSQAATIDRVNMLSYGRGEEVEAARKAYEEKKEAYVKQAPEVIDWGINYVEEQLKAKGPTDYMNNLRVILKGAKELGGVATKHAGYFLSIIPFYKRAKEQEAAPKEAAKESNYVGVVGYPIGDLNPNDRRKMKKAGVGSEGFPYNGPIWTTVKSARGFERQGFGYYDRGGAGTVLSLVDDQGNVYVVFTNYRVDEKPGDKMLIKRALVKSHKDYTDKAGRTTKQTTLSRVDFGTYDEVEKLGSFKEHYHRQS